MISAPGLLPKTVLNPTWLTNALLQIFPTTIKQLWMADDAHIAAGVVDTWPSRVGSLTLSYVGTPNITKTTVNGRLVLANSVNAVSGALTAVNVTAPASIIVTTIPNSLPASADSALFFLDQVIVGRRIFGLTTGTSIWFANSNPHYCNGVASETISSSWAVYEATNGAALTGYSVFGNTPTGLVNYQGQCGLILTLTTNPTTTQRTNYVQLVRGYYGW